MIPAFSPARRLLPWFLVALALSWLAARLQVRALSSPFDYDEVAEAHAVWQVGQGMRPYRDFYHDHAPYSWLVWAPVLKALPEAFESLVLLRLADVALSLLALGLLILLVRDLLEGGSAGGEAAPPGGAGPPPPENGGSLAAAAVAVAVMATHPSSMAVLHQFRGDQLSLVFTLLGLLALGSGGGVPSARRCGAAGLFLMSGLLITPKLVLLCALTVVLHGARLRTQGPGLWRPRLAGLLGGAALGFCLWNAWAFAAGVDPSPFYRLALAYHWANLRESGQVFGAGRELIEGFGAEPVWLVALVAGLAAGAAEIRGRGAARGATLTALVVFCLVQPLWVKLPWKQYLFSVCLFWSAPLAVFLQRAVRARRLAGWALLALFAGGFGLQEVLRSRADAGDQSLAEHLAWGNEVLSRSIPGRTVAVQPPLHPVFRRDATYYFNLAFIPAGRGPGAALRRPPAGAPRASYEGYMEQFEAAPPSIVLASPYFTDKDYMRAALDFVRVRHPKAYRRERIAGRTAYVRSRGWDAPSAVP
ncbi:MAG: hypothetical protein HY924_13125 [Elusimicrobia bacterium]|nr:hypothetical protein [Elusimicrobiota bacterium]